MTNKELIDFMHNLHGRGVIGISPIDLDYEFIVWDYLRRLHPKCEYLPDGTTGMNCVNCGKHKWSHQ